MNQEKYFQNLSTLKRQIEEFKKEKKEQDIVHYALDERVKELNCLYGLSKLASQKNITLEKIFYYTVKLIPPGWQYPEITCSRIIYKNTEYKTDNFNKTAYFQSYDIIVSDKKTGIIEVYYLKEKPFLPEEYKLLKAIAERLGKISQRILAQNNLKESERKLRLQMIELENKNIALRELLSQIEIEKNEIKENLLSNINKIILPVLHKIKQDKNSIKQIDILEKSLKELASPFAKKIASSILKLTPREIEICNMIKIGLSSKEIADNLNLSKLTIEKHRAKIRKKLGLTNTEYNLVSYLNSL